MQATGLVRRIDDLGRIVIPKEIRQRLHIHEGDPMELYMDGNKVIFQPYKPGSVSNALCVIQHSLSYHMIDCATYDLQDLLSPSFGAIHFPEHTPEVWRNEREPFECYNNNIRLFVTPFVVQGDLVGYVAVTSDKESVGATVKMVCDVAKTFLRDIL